MGDDALYSGRPRRGLKGSICQKSFTRGSEWCWVTAGWQDGGGLPELFKFYHGQGGDKAKKGPGAPPGHDVLPNGMAPGVDDRSSGFILEKGHGPSTSSHRLDSDTARGALRRDCRLGRGGTSERRRTKPLAHALGVEPRAHLPWDADFKVEQRSRVSCHLNSRSD